MERAKRFAPKYLNQYDRRETKPDLCIFNGFSAIHYAAYHGNVEMLEFLLPKEYAEQTKELVTMDCPGFTKGGKLKIPS